MRLSSSNRIGYALAAMITFVICSFNSIRECSMEISLINSTSVKIKGKNASLVIDPTAKQDADIIIATKPLEALAVDKIDGVRLVIAGPGEYEAGGISITGKSSKGSVLYNIIDSSRIMFVTSNGIASVPDDEEYDCLLIEVVGELKEDAFASINAKCVVLFGDLMNVTVTDEKKETTSKVNIKKTAEIAGKIFFLA